MSLDKCYKLMVHAAEHLGSSQKYFMNYLLTKTVHKLVHKRLKLCVTFFCSMLYARTFTQVRHRLFNISEETACSLNIVYLLTAHSK